MFVVEEIGGQLHNLLVYHNLVRHILDCDTAGTFHKILPNLQVNNLPLHRYVPFLSGPNHHNFLNGYLLAI